MLVRPLPVPSLPPFSREREVGLIELVDGLDAQHTRCHSRTACTLSAVSSTNSSLPCVSSPQPSLPPLSYLRH